MANELLPSTISSGLELGSLFDHSTSDVQMRPEMSGKRIKVPMNRVQNLD